MVELLGVMLIVLRRMHVSITASWFLEHVVCQWLLLLLLLNELVSIKFSCELLLIAIARSSVARVAVAISCGFLVSVTFSLFVFLSKIKDYSTIVPQTYIVFIDLQIAFDLLLAITIGNVAYHH
jgi:hypothetical protein